jgi:hypothetical protein
VAVCAAVFKGNASRRRVSTNSSSVINDGAERPVLTLGSADLPFMLELLSLLGTPAVAMASRVKPVLVAAAISDD